MDYREFEEKLGHRFHNKKYLITALTHSSYANEAKGKEESNERLEFLGDSVLGFVVADYLFKNYTQFPEGDLTKNRAALVCEADRPGELSAVEPRRAEFRRAHPLVHFGGCV